MTTGTNPYEDLPAAAFWKPSVASKSLFDIDTLWEPKFRILPRHKVTTYGSCFAQHIGRALRDRGFNWLITESAPDSMGKDLAARYGYGVFSSRTGNIYTSSLLLQWVKWACGKASPPEEIWARDDRVIDPFRPRVEPDGFETVDEMRQSRLQTIRSFKDSFVQADYFVFTMGLTESWHNTDGYEYPMCPGTVAGSFDEARHKFENQKFGKILKNLSEAFDLMRGENPKLRFILTVSPVPLTATNSGRHVVVATMASKSILRAVADQLSENRNYVDYFPSYEFINSPVFRGTFFEPNQRNISAHGVQFVMDNFFRCMSRKYGGETAVPAPREPQQDESPIQPDPSAQETDPACDEALLEAFGERR